MTEESQYKVIVNDSDVTQEITQISGNNLPDNSSPSFNHNIMSQFKLTQQLGQGGGGTVFAAKDLKLQRDVAIKMLRLDNYHHNQTVLCEARIQAKIDHPNICKIFQVIEASDKEQSSYLVMQLISGQPANQWREQQTRLDTNIILEWVHQVCRGLYALHAQGIIHRDIKPSNIMLDTDKYGQIHPYIVDFGIANQQHQQQNTDTTPHGTPSYMSPEQFRNSQLDFRSDIFSLGATMYQLFTGRPPAKSTSIINLQQNFNHPQWHCLPAELKLIISKCMAYDPKERFQSAKALSDEICRYLDNEALQINTNKGYRLRKSLLKNKWPFIFALTLSVSIPSFLSWRQWQTQEQIQLQQQLANSLVNTKNIEQNILIQRLNPPANLTQKLNQWTLQLEQIAGQIQQLPSKIQGQGYYNIGKIYYELQNYQQALKFLDKAWQNHYRQPRVAYYLALTHGAIYQQKKQFTDQMVRFTTTSQNVDISNEHHKKQALEYLKLGTKAAPSPQFADALNHFYNERYSQAINQLKSIDQLPNSSYQHLTLHGDIFIAKAQKDNKISKDRASFYAEKAINFYHEAQQKGRSDLYLYLKSFHAYNLLLERKLYENEASFNKLFSQAMAQINTAIKIMPEDYQAYYFKGLFLTRKSQFDDQYNDLALTSQTLAIADLRKALKLSNNDPQVMQTLAVAYYQQLKLNAQNNQPITPLMHKAITAFADIPKDFHDYYYHNNFGNLHYTLGVHFSNMDNRPLNRLSTDVYFKTAILHFERAQKLQPNKYGAKNNAVLTQFSWAESTSLARAHDLVEDALQILKNTKNINNAHLLPFNLNQAVGYNKLAKIRAALTLDFGMQIRHAKYFIDLIEPNQQFNSNVLAELANNSTLEMIYRWQQGILDTDVLLPTKMKLDEAIRQNGNNQRNINSLIWVHQIEQQLIYLTKPDLIKTSGYNRALAFVEENGRNNQDTLLLLKLINGQWQDINQQRVLALKHGDHSILVSALWFSNAKHYQRANNELEKLKAIPKSIVWAYQLQNLTQWQNHLYQQNITGPTLEQVTRHKSTINNLLKATYPKLSELIINND